MRDARDHLKDAMAIIEDPAHWTQGANARTQNQSPVRPGHSEAVCWCAMGAIIRAYQPGDPSHKAIHLLSSEMNGSIIEFNDTVTHARVIAAFKRAIGDAP